MFLTANTLRRLGACDSYVSKFRELFPSGTEVTPELCAQHQEDFDWHWAAAYLMSPQEKDEWNRRLDEANAAYNQRANELRQGVEEARRAQHRADEEATRRVNERIRPIMRQRDEAIAAVRRAFDAILTPLNDEVRAAYAANAEALRVAQREYDEALQPLRVNQLTLQATTAGEIMAARTAPPGMDPVTPETANTEAADPDRCYCGQDH